MNAFWWGIAFGMPRLEELELHKQHGRWTNLGESLYNLVNVNVNVNDLENVNSNTNATNTATKNTTLFENLRSVLIFADGAPAGAGRNYNNRNYSNNRLWTEDDNSDDSCGVVVGDSVLEFFATRLPRLKSVVVESEALAETASTNTNTNTNKNTHTNTNTSISVLLKSTTLESITIVGSDDPRRRNDRSRCYRRRERQSPGFRRVSGSGGGGSTTTTTVDDESSSAAPTSFVLRSFCKSLAVINTATTTTNNPNLQLLRTLDIGERLDHNAVGFLADAIRGASTHSTNGSGLLPNLQSLAIAFCTAPHAHGGTTSNNSSSVGDDNASVHENVRFHPTIQKLCDALKTNTSLLHVTNYEAEALTVNRVTYECAILQLLERFNYRLRALDLCRVVRVGRARDVGRNNDDDDGNSNNNNNNNNNDDNDEIAKLLEVKKDFFLKLNFWGRERFLRRPSTTSIGINYNHINNIDNGRQHQVKELLDLLLLLVANNETDCIHYFLSRNSSVLLLMVAGASSPTGAAGKHRLRTTLIGTCTGARTPTTAAALRNPIVENNFDGGAMTRTTIIHATAAAIARQQQDEERNGSGNSVSNGSRNELKRSDCPTEGTTTISSSSNDDDTVFMRPRKRRRTCA